MRLKLIGNCLLLGLSLSVSACGLPDWADSALSSGSEYGPVPQPVSRGNTPAKPVKVAENLNGRVGAVERAANPNAEKLTQTPKLARNQTVVEQRTTQARERAARVAAVANTQPPAAPAPAAVETPKVVINAPAAPQPQQVAKAPEPQVQSQRQVAEPVQPPRVTDVDRSSPTPMIAAMTRNQRAPRFSTPVGENGAPQAAVSKPYIPSTDGQSARIAATAVQDPTGTPDRVIEAGQPVYGGTNTPSVATSVAQAAPLQQQPVLADTYRKQLAAGGLNPAALDANAPTGRAAAPTQFPSTVPQNVAQNYVQSLQAPRTYEQAVGAAPAPQALSTVVIGGDQQTSFVGGPVIVGGQQAGYVPTGGAGLSRQAQAIITFGHNSARLSSKDVATINRVAAQAKQTGALVRIVGHASSRTREMSVRSHVTSNLRISANRADAVADVMARAGVPYTRIIVEARGDNNPAFNEAMPSGEAGNRRAEIFLEN